LKIVLLCHAERHKDKSKILAMGAPLDRKDPANQNWWNGPTPHDKEAELTTLSGVGASQAAKAGEQLGFAPDVYLTSKSTHAWQTAQRLAQKNARSKPIPMLALWALTPGGEVPGTPLLSPNNLTLHHVISELAALLPVPVHLNSVDVAVVVGHHPRMEQLFRDVTRKRKVLKAPAEFTGTAWPKARGVCLEGSYKEFCGGKARVVRWL
jgi:phosphohistidine phosphatase SixA